MMDGMASGQTCIVQVTLGYEEFRNLRQHRRNETVLKKRVLEFIYRLYQTGFRFAIGCMSWRRMRSCFANGGWMSTIGTRLCAMPKKSIGAVDIGACLIIR